MSIDALEPSLVAWEALLRQQSEYPRLELGEQPVDGVHVEGRS